MPEEKLLRVCSRCGSDFEWNGDGRVRACEQCRKPRERPSITKNCSACGKEFTTQDMRRQYCSSNCKIIVTPKIPGLDEEISESGAAHYMTITHGDDLRFCIRRSKWYRWVGTHWKMEEGKNPNGLISLVRKTLHDLQKVQVSTDKRNQNAYKKAIGNLLSWQKLKNIPALMSTELELQRPFDQFDVNGTLINTLSGAIDLRNGECIPHEREQFFAHIVNTHYKPEATHPKWDKMVDDVTCGRKDLAKFMQVAVGYSLLGENPNAKMFIMYGPTAQNGKSTFLNIIRDVFGEDVSQQADWSTLRHSNKKGGASPELIRMQGKRFIITTESEKDKRISEQWVKAITGGENQVARQLYGEYIEFKPMCKLWLNTNHLPLLDSTDDGIWRRMEVVPFNKRFTGKEDNATIRAQMQAPEIREAILAWAIQGAVIYHKTLPEERWKWSPTVTDANNEYKESLSDVDKFLTTRMIITKDWNDHVKKKQLFGFYHDWCLAMNIDMLGKQLFNREVEHALGHEAKRGSKGEYWPGLKVDPGAPLDDV